MKPLKHKKRTKWSLQLKTTELQAILNINRVQPTYQQESGHLLRCLLGGGENIKAQL